MSGSVALSTAGFTDAEKADIRRFMRYPAYGMGANGFQSWRFFQAYGTLEYKMNNLAPAEFQVVRQYLATLYSLESAIPASGARLSTESAAVWTRNKNEVADRSNLYDQWCMRLAEFLGMPFGPTSARSGAIVI
jgi:hypothetical protein